MNRISTEKIYEKYLMHISNRKRYSNCFFDNSFLESEILKGKIAGFEGDDYFIVIHEKNDIHWLYYQSDSWNWFHEIKKLPAMLSPIYVSVVLRGRIETVSDFDLWSESDSFVVKHYIRMKMCQCDLFETNRMADYANEDDTEKIADLFQMNFDIVGDKIMDKEEIRRAIGEKRILCIKDNKINDNEIKAYIIFEDTGKRTYVRNICVNSRFRGIGLGRKIMEDYLNLHSECKIFTLWCDNNNKKALKLYRSLGYCEEETNNYIFKLE